MNTNRITRSPTQKPGKGPNGRGFCKWCETEVPKGRRSWCSEACIHESRSVTDLNYQRMLVEKRDKGICALCHVDTQEVSDLASRFHEEATELLGIDLRDGHRFAWWFRARRKHFLAAMGFTREHVWEMDHIVPVSEGGGGCGLDNLRTLCIPCHDEETAKLKGRLAAKARAEKKMPVQLTIE